MLDNMTEPPAAGDETNENVELPVSTKTLSIDGTEPEVGDQVEFKVGGSVTRVVNGMAYCKPETINGSPIEAGPISPNDEVDETDRLRQMSETADMGGSMGSPGGY